MTQRDADAEWYRTTMSRWLNNRGTTVFVGHYLTKDSLKNLEESPGEKKTTEEPARGKPSEKTDEK